MKCRIVIINGAPRVGKDTFVNMVSQFTEDDVFNISTVDFVKKVAKMCGWDGTKTPKNRKFLSDLKDLLNEWDSVPYNEVKDFIDPRQRYYLEVEKDCFIFVHSREPEEIERFKQEYNAITLLIRRENNGIEAISNHADREVENYNYDYIINNNGNLQNLEELCKMFIEEIESR